MAPLVIAMRDGGILEPVIIATGQHSALVDEALDAFGLEPEIRLDLLRTSGSQAELVTQLVPELDAVLETGTDAVVVQGDTTSALVGGLVAMWRGIPVVHLEAGLRSGDLSAPFPEEANRRMLSVFADLHLAPTARAADALLAEGVPVERILLVGNTVVDAVLATAAETKARTPDLSMDPRVDAAVDKVARGTARLMLVTAHRRESWGEPLDRVLRAVRQIVDDHPDVICVVPTHPNPAVRHQVDVALEGHDRIVVIDALPYPQLCRLLAQSSLVLSDSGGIQEEAPSFGVPVLVLRDVTERMEAVEEGWAVLVGTDLESIVVAAKGVLDRAVELPSTGNPFGDGHAGARSAQAIAWLLGCSTRPEPFVR
jgi:UDP-N-acetylglucosamine 2-epimerase (non-hydrolysing)